MQLILFKEIFIYSIVLYNIVVAYINPNSFLFLHRHNFLNKIKYKYYSAIIRKSYVEKTSLSIFFKTPFIENKVIKRFQQMVQRFSSYTDEDVYMLKNPRLQVLINGGLVALNESKVCKAFEILYEDILPVRLGGDILFNLLDKSIIQARSKKYISTNKVKEINNNTSNDLNSISLNSKLKKKLINKILTISQSQISNNDCYITSLFSTIDQNNDGGISREEFRIWIESIITTDEEENIGWNQSLDAYLGIYEEIDMNQDGTLSLDELKLWTTGIITNNCNEYSMVTNIDSSNTITINNDIKQSSKSSQKQYLYMVKQFSIWGENWDKSHAKKIDFSRFDYVIVGCFSGAKIPAVVDALQILYEDYVPLRIAGDIIFKLVEKVMIK